MKKPHFILLPGWGMETCVWDSFGRELNQQHGGSVHKEMVSYVDWRGIRSQAEIKDRVLQKVHAIPDRSLILLGWSLGALAALDVAATHPSRVEGLILIGGTSCFTSVRAEGGENRAEDRELRAYRENGWGWDRRILQRMKGRLQRDHEGTVYDFYRSMFSFEEHNCRLSERFLRHVRTCFQGDDIRSLQLGLDYLAEGDFRVKLPYIKSPLLLLHGKEDVICPPESAAYIARKAGGPVTLSILNGTGHVPFYSDRGRDECLLRIKKFVEKK
jgi:pimeloyl-[acyl-carrier protein] methyl ester esterase